jgi:hypothetical protein
MNPTHAQAEPEGPGSAPNVQAIVSGRGSTGEVLIKAGVKKMV